MRELACERGCLMLYFLAFRGNQTHSICEGIIFYRRLIAGVSVTSPPAAVPDLID